MSSTQSTSTKIWPWQLALYLMIWITLSTSFTRGTLSWTGYYLNKETEQDVIKTMIISGSNVNISENVTSITIGAYRSFTIQLPSGEILGSKKDEPQLGSNQEQHFVLEVPRGELGLPTQFVLRGSGKIHAEILTKHNGFGTLKTYPTLPTMVAPFIAILLGIGVIQFFLWIWWSSVRDKKRKEEEEAMNQEAAYV